MSHTFIFRDVYMIPIISFYLFNHQHYTSRLSYKSNNLFFTEDRKVEEKKILFPKIRINSNINKRTFRIIVTKYYLTIPIIRSV